MGNGKEPKWLLPPVRVRVCAVGLVRSCQLGEGLGRLARNLLTADWMTASRSRDCWGGSSQLGQMQSVLWDEAFDSEGTSRKYRED